MFSGENHEKKARKSTIRAGPGDFRIGQLQKPATGLESCENKRSKGSNPTGFTDETIPGHGKE